MLVHDQHHPQDTHVTISSHSTSCWCSHQEALPCAYQLTILAEVMSVVISVSNEAFQLWHVSLYTPIWFTFPSCLLVRLVKNLACGADSVLKHDLYRPEVSWLSVACIMCVMCGIGYVSRICALARDSARPGFVSDDRGQFSKQTYNMKAHTSRFQVTHTLSSWLRSLVLCLHVAIFQFVVFLDLKSNFLL